MAEGLGEGWEDEFSSIKKNIDNSLKFDDASIGISSFSNLSSNSNKSSGNNNNVFNITINGANFTEPKEFAEAIASEIQILKKGRATVFGNYNFLVYNKSAQNWNKSSDD